MSTDPMPLREFQVTTNFQIEALKPGGLSRDEALRQAEHNLALLRLSFPKTLDEQIDGLWQAADLARDGDAAWRDQLRLRCIDLSDAATTIGCTLVAYIATSLRDACDSVAFETRRDEIVACHVDAIHLCGSEAYANLNVEDVPELTDRLQRIVQDG